MIGFILGFAAGGFATVSISAVFKFFAKEKAVISSHVDAAVANTVANAVATEIKKL